MTSVNIDGLNPVATAVGITLVDPADIVEVQQTGSDDVNRKLTIDQLMRLSFGAPVREVSGTSATVGPADLGAIIVCNNTSLMTVTLPSDTVGIKGTVTMLMNNTGNVKTVRTVAGVAQAAGMPGGRNAINERYLAMQWAYVGAATPLWVLAGAVTTL